MTVVDTGALLALLDASEDHHAAVRALYEERPDQWLLPSAILSEVDYLLATHVGAKAQTTFLEDLADGLFFVDWGRDADLLVARRICSRYKSLKLGLVDAMVMATAERIGADAIATLDLRHFGAVTLPGSPRLLPRDS